MKKNNRGFTLTELVIAVAILGIVTLGVYGFMIAGSRTYRSVSEVVNLQTAAQQTMGQIQEITLDCDRGVYTDTTALYLLESKKAADGTTEYTLHVYTLDGENQKMNYQQVEDVSAATAAQKIAAAPKHLLSAYVSAFSVTPQTADNRVSSLTMQMTFRQNEKQYQATQTVALRNLPAACTDLEALFALAN